MNWVLFSHRPIGQDFGVVLAGFHREGIIHPPREERVDPETGKRSIVVYEGSHTRPQWLRVLVFNRSDCELRWAETYPDALDCAYERRVVRWDGKPEAPFFELTSGGFDIFVSDDRRLQVRETVQEGRRSYKGTWAPPLVEVSKPMQTEKP